MTYDQWIAKVDTFFYKEIGLSHDDIEDWRWYDAYDDGYEPEEAAKECLYDQGYFLD